MKKDNVGLLCQLSYAANVYPEYNAVAGLEPATNP